MCVDVCEDTAFWGKTDSFSLCHLPSPFIFTHLFQSLLVLSVPLTTSAVMTSVMNHRQIFKDFLPTYISLSDSSSSLLYYSLPLLLFCFFFFLNLDYGSQKLSMFCFWKEEEPKYSQRVTENVKQTSPFFLHSYISLCLLVVNHLHCGQEQTSIIA